MRFLSGTRESCWIESANWAIAAVRTDSVPVGYTFQRNTLKTDRFAADFWFGRQPGRASAKALVPNSGSFVGEQPRRAPRTVFDSSRRLAPLQASGGIIRISQFAPYRTRDPLHRRRLILLADLRQNNLRGTGSIA